MAFVITRLCRDCLDQSCVSVCPVDCILEFQGDDPSGELSSQLYINPDECIDCGVCAPECPWEAIFEDEDVPSLFKDDIPLNARTVDRTDAFAVPEVVDKEVPTPEQVVANEQKWGFEG